MSSTAVKPSPVKGRKSLGTTDSTAAFDKLERQSDHGHAASPASSSRKWIVGAAAIVLLCGAAAYGLGGQSAKASVHPAAHPSIQDRLDAAAARSLKSSNNPGKKQEDEGGNDSLGDLKQNCGPGAISRDDEGGCVCDRQGPWCNNPNDGMRCTLHSQWLGKGKDKVRICPGDACDDSNECTENDVYDVNFECHGSAVVCDDQLWCNGQEDCNVETGCFTVAGTVPVVDDGIPCTDDSCDEDNDVVVNAPNDGKCTDNDVCNGVETCSASSGCEAGTPLTCDDGLWCNGVETCDATLGCQDGAHVVVDDGVDCTDDSCDEATDSVVNTPNDAHCSDNDVCNGDETCSSTHGCQAGTALTCDDGAYCNGVETCDAGDGCQPGIPPCDVIDETCVEARDHCVPFVCQPGNFRDASQGGLCVPCPAGTFSASTDSTSCTPCSDDRSLDSPNDANCDLLQGQKVCDPAAGMVCTACIAPFTGSKCDSTCPGRTWGAAIPVDFSAGWIKSPPNSDGDWRVYSAGARVVQHRNTGLATWWRSPQIDMINFKAQGKMRVATTGDDDYIGMSFGFTHPNNQYYHLAWKQNSQNFGPYGGLAREGFTFGRKTKTGGDMHRNTHWVMPNANSDFTTIIKEHTSTNGWIDNRIYTVYLEYLDNCFFFRVTDDVTKKVVVAASGTDSYQPGGIALYSFSQAQCDFFNWEISEGY